MYYFRFKIHGYLLIGENWVRLKTIEGGLETMVYYSQREGDQRYQRTPYHSRRSMIQTSYEVEFHLLILSVLCLMSYVC